MTEAENKRVDGCHLEAGLDENSDLYVRFYCLMLYCAWLVVL